MDIAEIVDRYHQGHYTYNENIPAKVKDSYVFDENLSVKRNREMVVEHNNLVELLQSEVRRKRHMLHRRLVADIVTYITDTYDLNKQQARVIESFAYCEKHSSMSDYFNSIDTFAEFAEKLIKSKEEDLCQTLKPC